MVSTLFVFIVGGVMATSQGPQVGAEAVGVFPSKAACEKYRKEIVAGGVNERAVAFGSECVALKVTKNPNFKAPTEPVPNTPV